MGYAAFVEVTAGAERPMAHPMTRLLDKFVDVSVNMNGKMYFAIADIAVWFVGGPDVAP